MAKLEGQAGTLSTSVPHCSSGSDHVDRGGLDDLKETRRELAPAVSVLDSPKYTFSKTRGKKH